jgi:hypothetical protein
MFTGSFTHVLRQGVAGRIAALSAFVGAAMLGLAVTDGFADSDARPGATDPMGKPARYTLFPDHELFAMVGFPGIDADMSARFVRLTPTSDLTSFSAEVSTVSDFLYVWGFSAVASGRITDPMRDPIVFIKGADSFLYDEAEYVVGMFDPSNPAVPIILLNVPKVAFTTTWHLDTAVGDLDRLTDSEGLFHDEVVAVYVLDRWDGDDQVVLLVGNLHNGQDQIQWSSVSPSVKLSSDGEQTVGVAVGDFDGDARNEIAVVHESVNKSVQLTTFRYAWAGTGEPTLQQVDTLAGEYGPRDGTNDGTLWLDMVAADLNGDDKDEIAVSWNGMNNDVNVKVYGTDANLKLTARGASRSQDKTYGRGLRITAGLFKYDPANGYTLGRRPMTPVNCG